MRHRWLFPVALIATAAAVRLLSIGIVGSGDAPNWIGGPDSFYQERRVALVVSGNSTSVDSWINYPSGERVHWPPAWARLGALAATVGGSRALGTLPVLTGLMAVLLFAHASRRALTAPGEDSTRERPAMTAYDAESSGSYALTALPPALFALAPALVYPALFGNLDHHALESLWLALGTLGATRGGRSGCLLAAAAVAGAAFSVPAWPLIAILALLPFLLVRAESSFRSVLLLVAGALCLPLAGFAYFSDPWIRGIDEARPMFSNWQGLPRAVLMVSPGVLVLPWMLAAGWRSRTLPAMATVLVGIAVALPLALLQVRFVPYLVYPSAVALALGLRRMRIPRAAVVVLAVASLLPPIRGIAEIPGWETDPPVAVGRALRWIAERTPTPGDWREAAVAPTWGVAAAWDLGPVIVARARRPAVAGAFHTGHSGRTLTARILGDPPAIATRIADDVPAPVLLLTNLAGGYAKTHGLPGQPPPIDALYGRLYFRADTTLGWSRAHASAETFAFEGLSVPEVQVWIRDGFLPTSGPTPAVAGG